MLLKERRQTPEPLARLGDVRQLFLDEERPIEEQQAQLAKALQATLEIISIYYPKGRTGDTALSVPSKRLVELGLVSDETGQKIIKLAGAEAVGEEETSTIIIEPQEEGYTIMEKYTEAEGFHSLNGHRARLDRRVEERTFLKQTPEGFSIRTEGKKMDSHIHALNGVWQLRESGESPLVPIEVTARRVNTTLALLVEGTYAGYIRA